jgi:hypothetical protein
MSRDRPERSSATNNFNSLGNRLRAAFRFSAACVPVRRSLRQRASRSAVGPAGAAGLCLPLGTDARESLVALDRNRELACVAVERELIKIEISAGGQSGDERARSQHQTYVVQGRSTASSLAHAFRPKITGSCRLDCNGLRLSCLETGQICDGGEVTVKLHAQLAPLSAGMQNDPLDR